LPELFISHLLKNAFKVKNTAAAAPRPLPIHSRTQCSYCLTVGIRPWSRGLRILRLAYGSLRLSSSNSVNRVTNQQTNRNI